MSARAKGRYLAAGVILCLPMLAACQSYLPQNDEPLRVSPVLDRLESGPSSQRLDENGYPLIGAYPSAATQQVSNDTVAATRERYANVSARGAAPSSAPTYQRNVAELEATAARVRAAGQANAN